MIRALTFLLATIIASTGYAGQLEIVAPESPDAQFPLVSLYANAEADSAPIATATSPGSVQYSGDGPVWLGLNGHSGRIGPLTADLRVEFGVLELLAPENASGRYGVLGANGAFFGVVNLSEKHLLPIGQYTLRRDLGDATIPVEISGEITTLSFGVVSIAHGAIPNEVIYFAQPADLRVVATLRGDDRLIGLPPGRYALANGPDMPITQIAVQAGATTQLSAYALRFEGRQGDPVEISVDGNPLRLPLNTSIRLFSETRPTVASAGFDTVALSPDTPFILWQNTDGGFVRAHGIEVHWQSQPLIISGGTIDLALELPSPAEVTAVVEQGDQRLETVFGAMSGRASLSVPAPDNLQSGAADVRVIVRRLADNLTLLGESNNIPVHLPPGDTLSDLRASGAGQTTITLTWQSAPPSPVNIYRNASDRPVNGLNPVADVTSFQDIGLSAGRSYSYQVCPVDALGLEGPCRMITAATLRR